MATSLNTRLKNPIKKGSIRKRDKWGKGHYGAARGKRLHNGIDIVAPLGADVFSPINAKVVRLSYPYAKDLSYTGLLLEGIGIHKGYSIKIFYIKPLSNMKGKILTIGEKIGSVQDLTIKYPGITNHIHIEVKFNGIKKNPKLFINKIY